MGIIMRNNIAYSGGGGSETVELSMAEYEAREAAGAIDSDTWYLIYDANDSYNAKKIVYDNAESGMEASTVQGAIDELNSNIDDQSKNLQWYIDNGFLPSQNDICDISVYNNRCQIVRNGCYVKNGVCYIDLLIFTNISGDTPLNSTQAYTLILGMPQRRDSGMLTLKSSDGTFGIEDSRIFVSKCSNYSVYQINGWYHINN